MVKHGTFLQLKQRKTCQDRFSFVATFQVSLDKRKASKYVILVHDAQNSASLKSCTVSDIHGICGWQALNESERMVLQLAQSIVKQGNLLMVDRYDKCTHASSKESSSSAYSPLVNVMTHNNSKKKSTTVNKNKQKPQRYKKPKVIKPTKNEEEKQDEEKSSGTSLDEYSLISEKSSCKRHRYKKTKLRETSGGDNLFVSMLVCIIYFNIYLRFVDCVVSFRLMNMCRHPS